MARASSLCSASSGEENVIEIAPGEIETPSRQISKLLADHGGGRLYQEDFRAESVPLARAFENLREPLAAAAFIVRVIARRQTSKCADQFLAIRHAIPRSDLAADDGRQESRSNPPSTDLKQSLERFTVHPRPREARQCGLIACSSRPYQRGLSGT